MAPNGETNAYTRTSSRDVFDSKFDSIDRLRLFINGQWYDLTQWQHLHPGGQEILQHMNGKDATDAFFALHSEQAIQRLSRLKPCATDMPSIEPNDVTRSFRQLREKFIDTGLFQRSIAWELFYHSSVYLMCLLGMISHFYFGWNLLAILAIGLAMQQAGWIGHDYAHGRGSWMEWMCRVMTGSVNGFSRSWWSHKHNTHHVYTNNVGIDADIANDPVFHLFFPSKENDVWFRHYQHIYFVPVYSLLYLSWRWQSLQHAWRTSEYRELMFISLNYFWLFTLGWPVALGSVLLGGFLVAGIVTATHQSEEMLFDSDRSFVETQFLTTCDARCDHFLMEWLWGGMQYQVEHHLFPTMPKYNYARVRPIIAQWAKDNGVDYRCESVWSIWGRNYQTMKHFASPTSNTREAA